MRSSRTDYDSWPYRGHEEQGREDARYGRRFDRDLGDRHGSDRERAYARGFDEEVDRRERERREEREREEANERERARRDREAREYEARMEQEEYERQRYEEALREQDEQPPEPEPVA